MPTHNLTAPAPGGTAPVGALAPGAVTPGRPVPASIPRPEYVGRAEPDEGRGGDVYTPDEIELIRAAGRIAARALQEAGRAAVPGTTTDELDRIAHEYLCDHGAYPSCLGYRGFPKSICTSLNEVICHGIPDSTVLEEGDIINLDVTAYKDGFHGDTNRMFLVGEVDEQSRLLVERTEEALNRAVKAVRPAGRSMSSAASSRSTPGASTTAWCGTSPATGWAGSSTPG